MNEPDRAEQIREEMRRIRLEMGDEVDKLADSVDRLTDWRTYVHSYPLVCMGAAVALGYFVIPRRKHTPPAPVVPAYIPGRSSGGLKSTLFTAARGAFMKAALGYASQALTAYLAAKTAVEASQDDAPAKTRKGNS